MGIAPPAHPPTASGASQRAGRRNAQRNALVLPEKQYKHHNRHWYCQHQV